MELTVGKLKEILAQVDDNTMLADLGYGNESFRTFANVKRVMVLENTEGERYLTINGLGSHFSGEGDQRGLKYTGICFTELP